MYQCLLRAIVLLAIALNSYAVEVIPNVKIGDSQSISQFSYHTKSVAPVLSISKAEIKRSGAKNFSDVLALAGLQQRDIDGDGSNLQLIMRGFANSAGQNVLVLLNGNPLSFPDLGSFNFNQIPVAQIEAIQVYSNSMGVYYGDQAIAGVINIITTKKINNTQHISLAVGSYDTYQANAGISRLLKNGLGYSFNIGGLTSDQYRQHNKTSNMSTGFGVSKQFKHSQLALHYQYYQQYLLYPGALTASQVAENRRQAQTLTDSFNNKIQNLQTRYQQQLGSNWQFNIAGLVNQMHGNGVLTNVYQNKRQAVDINPSIDGVINVHNMSLISHSGLTFSNGNYRFDTTGYNTAARQSIYSAFSQLNIPFTDAWHMIVGGRYATAQSRQSISAVTSHVDDHVFVSKIGFLWQPNSDLNVYLRRAGNFRFPKTDENVDTNTNKPLKPQTGVSYEAGFSWQLMNWNGLFSLYHMDLNNEISSIPIPNSTTSFALNQNLPKTKRDGLSVTLGYRPIEAVKLQTIYRYVHAVFSSGPDKGNDIPFVAAQTYMLAASWDISAHWRFTAADNYTGARRFDNDPEERSPKLSAYSVVNTNLQYHQPRWQIGLRVNNIFNKYYNAYAFDVYNGAQTTSYFYPAMGINFMVNLTMDL